MTSRERLLAAVAGRPVDRLPWTVDLYYYNEAMHKQGRFDARYEGVEGALLQYEELGIDPYFDYGAFPACEFVHDGSACTYHQESENAVTTYSVGQRTLTGAMHYVSESFCWAPYKYPVENVDDLHILRDYLRSVHIIPNVERHRARQQQWGDRGLVSYGLPRSPLPAMLTEWAGVETTTYLYLDEPELFMDVLELLGALYDPLYTVTVDYRPSLVHFCDNISGETIGSFWDELMAPYYHRRLAQLHAAGIICVIHNDGTMRSALDRIAATGFDGAEALTPYPVGDVALGDLRRLAGRDDFVLWGMLPGAIFSTLWPEEDFRAYVDAVFTTDLAPHILGSADQIPPDADINRVRYVVERINSQG